MEKIGSDITTWGYGGGSGNNKTFSRPFPSQPERRGMKLGAMIEHTLQAGGYAEEAGPDNVLTEPRYIQSVSQSIASRD